MDTVRPPIPLRVDATGTRRRLQALVAIGYPQRTLHPRIGLSAPLMSQILHGHAETVTHRVHADTAVLFDQLWQHPVLGAEGRRSRTIAKANRWVSPLAWDDIDDPAEKPNVSGPRKRPKTDDDDVDDADGTEVQDEYVDEAAVIRAMQGHKVRLRPADRREAIRRLHARRWSDGRIAKTLHTTERTVLRNRKRLELEAHTLADMDLEDSA